MKKLWGILVLGLCAVTAVAAAPAVEAGQGILVLGFAPAGEAGQAAWIGAAIQRNLMGEIGRHGEVRAVDGKALSATGAAGAAKAAREAGAQVAVYGTYAIQGGQVRLSGYLVDARSERVLGTLEASGLLRDLFGLEDALAQQMKQLLPAAQVDAGPASAAWRPPAPIEQSYPWEEGQNCVCRGGTGPGTMSGRSGSYPDTLVAAPQDAVGPTWWAGSDSTFVGYPGETPNNTSTAANRLVDGPTAASRLPNGPNSANRLTDGPNAFGRPVDGPPVNRLTDGPNAAARVDEPNANIRLTDSSGVTSNLTDGPNASIRFVNGPNAANAPVNGPNGAVRPVNGTTAAVNLPNGGNAVVRPVNGPNAANRLPDGGTAANRAPNGATGSAHPVGGNSLSIGAADRLRPYMRTSP